MSSFPSVSKDSFIKPNSPIQKCLNMINKVEDMVITFQSQNSSRPARSTQRRSAKSSDKAEEFIIIPQLKKAVEALKVRLAEKSSKNINVPNFRRFKQSLPTENLLGPGCYETRPLKVKQDHEFVAIPRLADRMMHRLSTMKARRKSLTFEESAKITIFDYHPPQTTRNPQEKAKAHNDKIQLVKAVGKEIKDYYQEIKKVKLYEKLERIKWLEKKTEIIALKKNWRKIISEISIASLLHLKIKNYKVSDI